MNEQVKKDWTAALRSGEYPQGQGALRTSNTDASIRSGATAGFCCLGVLCDLYHKATGVGAWMLPSLREALRPAGGSSGLPDVHLVRMLPATKPKGTYFAIDKSIHMHWLPEEVVNWAGLPSDNPYVEMSVNGLERSYSLAQLNDSEYTFAEIADIIDKQL